MKKIIFLLVLCLVFKFSYSQILKIEDAVSHQPLEGATIAVANPRMFTITNSKGQADISAFRNTEEIEIRMLGYKTEITTFEKLKMNDFILMMTPVHLNLDEVIISASRWNQPSTEIPSKISVIHTKDFQLLNPQTSADLLGISGKVFIQKSQQGGGSPMIRGFATNRLLYAVDGVRMNTAIFRGGNIQNVISLDPFAMEKTEILFGPGSVMYGSDAIGGVMSFQTLSPQTALSDEPFISGKAIFRFSSANSENTFHFDINSGWKKWALLTSISNFNFGDLMMGSFGPDIYLRPFYVQRIDNKDVVVANDNPKVQRPSGYSQLNIMQKIRYNTGENTDIQYGFHYSETSDYARYDRHIRYKNGLPRYAEWSYGPQKWMMNNLSFEHNSKNSFYDQMVARLAQQYFEESRFDRNINKNDRHIRTEKVNAYSFNLDFNKNTGKKNAVFYGLELILNEVISTGVDEDISTGTKVPGPSRYPQSKWKSSAIYLSDNLILSDKIKFQAGLRYNLYELNADFDTIFYPFPFTSADLSNGALTGNIGFVWKPEDKLIATAGVSTAFRSPNVDDIGKVFDSEPGKVVVPNPDLKAEYAYNAEIGFTKIFDDVVKIDFSAFYTLLKDALVRRDYQLNGQDSIIYDGEMSRVQAIQNAAKAYVYGIQAGIEVKLPSGFGFSGDINFQRGEEELDDGSISPSRHAAPMFGVTRIFYEKDKLNFQLYTIFSDKKDFEDLPEEEKSKTEIYAQDENGNPYSPGWYTLNFKVSYRLNEIVTFSSGIENLTDRRYRTYSSGICGAGRSFVISLAAAF